MTPACSECGASLVGVEVVKLRDGREVPEKWKTLVGYYSPPGHNHDDNCLKRRYKCAAGHHTILSVVRRCPAQGCDWVGKTECFCHPGKKLESWPELGQ